MTLQLFHNPRCRKSRAAKEYLNSKNSAYETIFYIEKGLTKEQLLDIVTKTNVPLDALLRKQETDYKIQIKGKEMNQSQLIDFLIEYPHVLIRPIVLSDTDGVVADPPENIEKLLTHK